MTRKQETSKVALEYANKEIFASPYDAFMAGAQWADQHPVNYDGNAMLYVCNKSHENGYKEAVDKACKWIEKNVADIYSSPCNPDKIVELFRKAMNNGCSNDGKLIINVYAHVRYWQDSKINGVYDDPEDPQMPCVVGADDDKYWVPKIEADTGLILNWTPYVEASIHYKVCDECELTFTKGDAVVSEYDGYVPDFLCPKEEGYGDYIIMDIDSNGYIKNWDKVKDNIEI